MKLTIQSIHFDADRKLTGFVTQKISKLNTFFDHIVDTQVYLKLEKNKQEGNKVVEIKVNVPSNTLLGTQRAKSFEEATDLCIEQMKKQIKRYKEKIRA
jgi:putative sigma-54 modulation protein